MLTFSILFTCNEDDENTDERDSSNNVVHHQRKATIHPKFGKGIEFFPAVEPDYAEVVVHARGNLSINDKNMIMKE